MGGIAENYYIPESAKDIELLISYLNGKEYYILSGGSNLLINDNKKFEHIIFMRDSFQEFENKENGYFYCGASVRVQKLINLVNQNGYGGIEELISLPGAMLGGLIYMNAGIGGEKNPVFTISDFIIRVYAIDRVNGRKMEFLKNDCEFKHRYSLFQSNQYIITGADLKFYEQDIEISKQRINARIIRCKERQDHSGGTFGSCYKTSNRYIMKVIQKLSIKKGNIKFSSKTSNWMLNMGDGKFTDAMSLIGTVQNIHKLFGKNVDLEVRVWK